MSTSVMLPLGCRPFPQTPKLPKLIKITRDDFQSLEDVFKRDLVLPSSPSPEKPQPVIPFAVPSDESVSPSACQFIWRERPRPMVPIVVPGEATDSATAMRFIRNTPVGQESPKTLSVSPVSCASSPLMRSRWRQSTGLLLEEDPDWDEKKVAPARNLWLKARRMLRQAGLNPRQVTMVYPFEAENTKEHEVSTRRQWNRANTDSVAYGVLPQASATPTALESGRECADENSTSSLVSKDALSKLFVERLKSKRKEKEMKPQDCFPIGRPASRTSSKDNLEPRKVVHRTRMAALGKSTLWMTKPPTV